MSEQKIPIPARLYNAAVGGHVAGTEDIIDDIKNKTQKEINTETDNKVQNLESAVGTGGSVDSRISSAVNAAKSEIKGTATSACDTLGEAETLISAEATRAQAAEQLLQEQYDALTQSDIVVGTLPTSGTKNLIYRVPGTNSYSDYMWNGSSFVKMAEYDNAIDDAPTIGSKNLVESGGVFDSIINNSINLQESKWISGASWANSGVAKRSNVEGMDVVYFKPSSVIYYAFLKDYDTTTPPNFATGYSGMVASVANQVNEIGVPRDAKFITINCGTNTFFLKGGVSLESRMLFKSGEQLRDISIEDFVSEKTGYIPDSTAVRMLLGSKITESKETATVEKYNLNIDAATNKWKTGSVNSYLYKVFKGEIVTIKSGSILGAVYAFLDDIRNIVAGEIPSYISGEDSVITLERNEEREIKIEQDLYLYIFGSDERWPASIKISRTVDGALYQYELQHTAPYDYFGAPICIAKRKYYSGVWKTFAPSSHQSFCLYGNYALFFMNGGATGKIFNIETETEVCTFNLPTSDGNPPHCNTVCVGNSFAEGNTDIPLIYLSMWNGNGACLVLDIHLDGTCTLVQTIKYRDMPQDKFGGDCGDWVVDIDRNKIYSCKYYLNTGDISTQIEGNKTMFCEFELPSLSDGAVVTFTESDILSYFSTEPMIINQDKFYNNGKLYIAAGSANGGISRTTLKIYVVDIASQVIVSKVDLSGLDYLIEAEGVDAYDNSIILSDSSKKLYKLSFE